MEMTWSSGSIHPALSTKLIVLFSLVWPFIVAAWLAKRGKSAAPVAAALVPIALGVADTWLHLANVTAIDGSGPLVHAIAAGTAEALLTIFTGCCFALGVLLFAAIRRHRAFLDRTTAVLIAIVLLDVVGAFVMATDLRSLYASAAIAAAAVAGIVAFLAILWTVLTGRGRRSSAPIPYGLPISAAAFVALVAITWTIVDSYREFAMGRG